MPRLPDSKLERLIEQAAVDCDSDEDVAMGLCYAMQEHTSFPFRGKVIGEEVLVLRVAEGKGTEVMAVCSRRGRQYRVRLDDIKLKKQPKGAEWIDAYLLFRRHC